MGRTTGPSRSQHPKISETAPRIGSCSVCETVANGKRHPRPPANALDGVPAPASTPSLLHFSPQTLRARPNRNGAGQKPTSGSRGDVRVQQPRPELCVRTRHVRPPPPPRRVRRGRARLHGKRLPRALTGPSNQWDFPSRVVDGGSQGSTAFLSTARHAHRSATAPRGDSQPALRQKPSRRVAPRLPSADRCRLTIGSPGMDPTGGRHPAERGRRLGCNWKRIPARVTW